MKDPVCSIVIPTYNGRRLLECCLGSIARAEPRESHEVIVVDDGSTDDTLAWLAENHPTVRVVALERNLGFCGAANAGIAAARGEFVQLLNNDTEVLPGWLEAGLAPFQDSKVGSTAPLVLVRSNPARVDSAGDSYSFYGRPSKRGHGEPASRWTRRPPEEVFGASGSSAFYRAEALRTVGAFDFSFGAYFEDVDLAFRLRWAGYTCIFTPASRILHEISATHDHASPKLQRRMSRNAEILHWSNMPAGLLIATLIPRAVFLACQAAWKSIRGAGRPYFRGKLDALKEIRSLAARRRLRAEFAPETVAPARFPLEFGGPRALLNHLRRPLEKTAIDRASPKPSAIPRLAARLRAGATVEGADRRGR